MAVLWKTRANYFLLEGLECYRYSNESVALGATRQAGGLFLADGLSRRQRAWPVGLSF